MPTPGLSMVGFMDEAAALHHLRFVCMPADPADAALRAVWQGAAAQLGAPTPNAGAADVQPIPQAQAAYVDQVRQTQWVDSLLRTQWVGAEFRFVEIAPLLAYQTTVNLARSAQHCGQVNNPPTDDEIFQICLPMALDNVMMQALPSPSALAPTGYLLKARNGNLRISEAGRFLTQEGKQVVGIALGVAPSLVHVVRFDGRHYLHNGYHRVAALMRAGATHVACVLRDVASAADVGLRDDGGTFKLQLLVGANPPTMAHYADGRALPVNLRNTTRIIHLSWSEYLAPENDDGA